MLLKRQLLLRQRQTKCQEESRLQKSRERLTEETEMAAIATMNMKTEGRILIILILPQKITIQDVKWKDVSERQKRTGTTTIVMMRLISMTSIVVQASMNRNGGLKIQCVKNSAVKWTNVSRKLIDTVMLRQAKVKLIQSVTKT